MGFALAVIGVCILIGGTRLRWLFWPERVLGAMPLTAYTAHLLVWAAWIAISRAEGRQFDPMDDLRALDPFWPMTLGGRPGAPSGRCSSGEAPSRQPFRGARSQAFLTVCVGTKYEGLIIDGVGRALTDHYPPIHRTRR
ncbi:hypothetical protein O4162_03555 [Dietzia maris]|uniref:hypothetical protein n=1 Tax=Dietzia maris TaxID=37915 RepID=UPI0022B2BBAE|nr:hypothetical protein [Dietzia maris]MCZ4539227.1 hypothetical protein [Dietzia maris]